MNSAKKLKLGWLIPYSGIFSNLKNDLRQGLAIAFQNQETPVSFEHYPEFIQTGGLRETEDAVKKLLRYEQVDLIIGIVSTKIALTIIPLAESHHTPLIILNLGADRPCPELSGDHLFYNSLHLWKSQWIMGRWAQAKYGGEPSINMSVYESGYNLHDAFRTGTARAGAATVKLNIVKNFTSQPDTLGLIGHIREQRPAHAHILLSGREGDHFLEHFHADSSMPELGLTINPFMAEDGQVATIKQHRDLYSASTWSLHLDNEENKLFKDRYSSSWNSYPNAFSLLAYEAGLALSSALQQSGKAIDRRQLTLALQQSEPTGPRGPIRIPTRPLQTDMAVHIRQPVHDPESNTWNNRILESIAGIEWNDPLLEQTNIQSGWQNPYLCV